WERGELPAARRASDGGLMALGAGCFEEDLALRADGSICPTFRGGPDTMPHDNDDSHNDNDDRVHKRSADVAFERKTFECKTVAGLNQVGFEEPPEREQFERAEREQHGSRAGEFERRDAAFE